jgi:hypothetical protein
MMSRIEMTLRQKKAAESALLTNEILVARIRCSLLLKCGSNSLKRSTSYEDLECQQVSAQGQRKYLGTAQSKRQLSMTMQVR